MRKAKQSCRRKRRSGISNLTLLENICLFSKQASLNLCRRKQKQKQIFPQLNFLSLVKIKEKSITMADPAEILPVAAAARPPLTPRGLEPKQVPMEWYRGLKSKITLNLKNVEEYVKEFEASGSVVRSAEEKKNIYAPLKKAEEALNTWDKYLEQHNAHEAWIQESRPGYVDQDLTTQTSSHIKYDEKYSAYVIKLNRLCSDFNAAENERQHEEQQRRRQRSLNSPGREAAVPYGPAAPQVVIVRENEATHINDSTRPDKLSNNASVLQFLNWKRDIKTFFTINTMDMKAKDVQISLLYSCIDETLRRFLDVHFASLPDVDIVSENDHSYLQALTGYFNQKHPLPVRVYDFFNERQRPSETPAEFAQRCEGLAITGNIDEMEYDDFVKYKIVTGLVHSEALRSKLLTKLNEPDFTSYKVKKAIQEYQATEKVTKAIDKHIGLQQVNQVSTYKRQQTSSRSNNYQQRQGPAPMPRVPFAPRPSRPPFQQSKNLACRQCGFTPFFHCQQHYRPRQQQRSQPQRHPAPFSRRIQVISEDQAHEGAAAASDDAYYVNTVNAITDMASVMALDKIDPEVIPVTAGPDYDTDHNGNPVMPNRRQTPLIYCYIREDRRRNYNDADKTFVQVNTPITKILALADSGCVQTVMHPNLARQCGLTVDHTDIVNMYAANGNRLNCLGSVTVQVSYFGIYTDLKAYLMNDVSPNYVILDRHVCQMLNIIHFQFPLPLHRSTLKEFYDPPFYPMEPFRGILQPNPSKALPAFPPAAMILTGETPVSEDQAGPARFQDTNPPQQEGQLAENSQISVRASFNDKSQEDSAVVKLNKLLHKYLSVFDINSRKDIKVQPAKLRFRKDIEVVPYKCTSSRPIPFALREAARKEVNEQIQLGILARVPPDAAIEWCSRGMVLPKENSRDCRIVCDSVELNKFLDRDAYPIQSPKELIQQIPPKSKFFLTCDFYKGFFQIPLAEEDQMKTTFMLHSLGLFHYRRVMQGGKTSVDIFNRITDELVQEVPDSLKMVDDVLFHGETVDEVLSKFSVLLQKCKERNFTLHPKKISFGNKLLFAGYQISDKGISIDPRKVEAIRKFERPQDVTDMKSFLGLAAQFQSACPHLMGVMKPLTDTTSYKVTPGFDEKTKKKIKNKNRKIVWNPNLEEAFIKAKKLLTDADGTILKPFDPNLPLVIYTDASRLNGYGWIAIQEKEGIKHLVECGSATIPDIVKRNFSVSELELSAVEMALRKMRLLTVCNPNVVIKTDHLPILGILKKPLDKIETRRLMRLAEKLQSYSFTIEHVAGMKNEVADALSRHPVKRDVEVVDANVVLAVTEDEDEAMSLKVLDKLAAEDHDYQLIREALINNVRAQNLPPDHPGRSYRTDWHLLGTQDNLVTFGETILVPKAARKELLQMLHFAHLGQQKTIALAKQLYFWKGMSNEISQLVDSCEKCQTHANFQQKETLKPTFAKYPMEMHAADLAEHGRKNYLIHMDRFSNFLWIYPLNKTTSEDIKKAMWQTFYQFGFPKTLTTDNGPQFCSDSFTISCKSDGIKQIWTSPYHSSGNGFIERAVCTAKNMIKKAEHPGDLQRMLMLYNSSPTYSSRSPAELLFSRKLRSNLPRLDDDNRLLSKNEIQEAVDTKKSLYEKRKQHYDKSAKDLPPLHLHQTVRIYNLKTSKWDTKGKIIYLDKENSRSYRVETQNGSLIWRNRVFLRPIFRSYRKSTRSRSSPTLLGET